MTYANKIIFKLTYRDHTSELVLPFDEGINAISYLQNHTTKDFLKEYNQQPGAYNICEGDVTYNGMPYWVSEEIFNALNNL